MLKQRIAAFSARLLRAAVGRISSDLELTRTIQATISSAMLIDQLMYGARACRSREEVMATAINSTLEDGFICELGVYKGQSLNELAKYFEKDKVYGFDTFTGLPEFWRDGFPQGAFDVSSEELKFEKNCVLYKGLFSETLPIFLNDTNQNARLIHIDCDLYSSSISALQILAPRIRPGTILVFDEYFNYPGWQEHEHKALTEFLEEHGFKSKYLAYNKIGQQVAVVII